MMLSQEQVELVGGCNCLVKKTYIRPRSIKEFHNIFVMCWRTSVISWVLL